MRHTRKWLSIALVLTGLSLLPVGGATGDNALIGVQEASACAFGSCKDMENVTCYTTAGPHVIIQEDACELGSPGC